MMRNMHCIVQESLDGASFSSIGLKYLTMVGVKFCRMFFELSAAKELWVIC